LPGADDTRQRVVSANIAVHTRMADSYNQNEPHFRPENRAKVRKVLEEIKARAKGAEKLLDLGCGTGFVIDLAKDLFREVHGVDVTQAMLDKVDRSSGNITLHKALAEEVPLPDASFDVVTAYSFIHHTADYWAVLREARRLLRPGGVLYVDLEPNKLFWERMEKLSAKDVAGCSAMFKKAWGSVVETDAKVEAEFGIPQATFRDAEFSKAILGGVDAREVERRAGELGFSRCEVRFEWFLGQGDVMHGQSFEIAGKIEDYLRAAAPLTDHLFKYVRVILTK
jgi:ubiquinone/menaquinone biosynthesis C-methylase UbiE